MFMRKRVVGEYIKDELRKGRTIEQIRKRLIETGYEKKDVNEVLRTFKLREADLKSRGDILAIQRTRVRALLVVVLLVFVANISLFFYYFSNPNYVLIKKTPTGFVVVGLLFLLFWVFFYFYFRKI